MLNEITGGDVLIGGTIHDESKEGIGLIGGDFDTASLIMKTDCPSEQKRLLEGGMGSNSSKVGFRKVGCSKGRKLRQNSGAREQLFCTKGRILAEALPTDLVWGAG